MSKPKPNKAAGVPTPATLTITIPQAALMMGICRQAAYNAANKGEIPVVRVGKRLLVPRLAFEQMFGGAGQEANSR